MLNAPVINLLIGILVLVGAAIALGAGYLYGRSQNKEKFEESLRMQKEASEQRLLIVQSEQREALREAREENARFRATIERENQERRSEIQRQEHRLQQKEENLERKIDLLEQRERKLTNKERTIEQVREEAEQLRLAQSSKLEEIARMSE